MRNRWLLVVAVVALLSIAGLFGASRIGLLDGGPVSLPMVEACRLHLESCSVDFPQSGRMTLDISPKQPSSSDVLQVVAAFEGVNPETVGIRFNGVNMNMGYLENFVFDLHRNDTAGSAVSFSGQAGVFACSVNLMQWRALVRVRTDSTDYELPFRFETRQQGQ